MTGNGKQYLVVVEYKDDAERKRAEYLLDNWDEGSITSLQGLSRRVEGVDVDDIYEKLVAKVPEENIDIHELTPAETEAERRTERLDCRFETDRDRVEWAMEAIIQKRKRITEDAANNVYGIYTKKGRATVSYSITEDPDGTSHLTGEISGYGDAPAFLHQYILKELEYMI